MKVTAVMRKQEESTATRDNGTPTSQTGQMIIYSGTSIYRFSRGWRNKTMNAGKRLIRETITHFK